jgi:hypothetical protein
MPEIETEVEGVEANLEGRKRGNSCKRAVKKKLKKLEDECEEITIFIQTGSKCCRRTGCLCDVNDCFAVLLEEDDPCIRTHILLDCICAVKNCFDDSCGCK